MHTEIMDVMKFISALSHLLFLSIKQRFPEKKMQQSGESIQKQVMLKLSYICGQLVIVGFVSHQLLNGACPVVNNNSKQSRPERKNSLRSPFHLKISYDFSFPCVFLFLKNLKDN